MHLALNISIFSLICFISLSSCTYNTLEMDPDPDPMVCDTLNISYQNTIAPIIQNNCFNNCHNGSSPTSGFLLDSYDDLKKWVDLGRVLGAINQKAGFVAMPLNGPLIPECDRVRIKVWIREGAIDN